MIKLYQNKFWTLFIALYFELILEIKFIIQAFVNLIEASELL